MIIYHGQPSPAKIERCKEAAPSHTHGAEWSPEIMTPHDWPYIIDNGAFAAYVNNAPWDADAFVGRLRDIEKMPREPDFVVLPDVVTNPKATEKRSKQWAGIIQYPTAFAVQDGVKADGAIEFAKEIGAGTIFVGGTPEWKHRNAEEFVNAAHDRGMKCHIGRPNDLVWANSIGADSVDTTSIVRNEAYHKLRALEEQQTLP